MSGVRRKRDIEVLLSWAYRQELSKLELIGASYSSMASMWEFGTKISDVGGGVFYECLLDQGNPHEDALLIHESVCLLSAVNTETGRPMLSDDWHIEPADLLSDMPLAVQAEASLDGYQVQRSALVMRFAKIGSRPDWRAEPPELRVVTDRGKEKWFVRREIRERGTFGRTNIRYSEENGYDKKSGRHLPGAYRKYEWEPPITLIIDRRADYCHWHASLSWLAEELATKLISHEPTGPRAAAMPWETGEAALARVLPALQSA